MKTIGLFLILIALFDFRLAMADDDFSKEVIKSTQLTSSMYMLEGAGGNITALIGPDGVLLVDDDFAQMADKLVAKLKELKGSSPRYIINTHFHYDHTGGNEVFGSTATIIAATEARERLMSEQTLWKKQHPSVPSQAWPTLTFDQSLKLHFDNEEIKITHLPKGHTDGDSVVFFIQQKVVSLGDLYFAGMYPIFHPEHNGSLNGYVKNIEKILREIPDDCKVVPGHGPLSNKAELTKYYQMIIASITTVRKGIRAGHTLEQIQKIGLPPQWESFGHGYSTTDRWIELLYKNLKNNQ